MKKVSVVVCIVGVFLSSCATTGKKLDVERYEYYEGVEKVANGLVRYLVKLPADCRIAVLPIISEYGNKTMLGDNIANSLQTVLFDPKEYTLVERERVDAILSELEFTRTDLVAEESIKELGKILAVDSIVVGTLRNEGDCFSLYCKIVDVETGKVQSLASALLSSTETMVKQYSVLTDKAVGSIKGAFELSIAGVQVRNESMKGIPWDAFSRPDIVVQVKVDGTEVFRSDTAYDRLAMDEAADTTIVLKEQSVLEIAIYDEDITKDELIGRYALTPDMLRELILVHESVHSDGDIVALGLALERL